MSVVRWTVGVKPESRRSPCRVGEPGIQSPESNVMALPWAVINCLLETDVLATPEKIKGAERGGRICRILGTP
jgi:hypothetical protein